MSRARVASVLAASVAAWLSLVAAQEPGPAQGSAPEGAPAAAGPQTTFRTGTDVIQLDVSVLDKDRQPVRGLTAEDFTVIENGKPQRVVAVTEIDAAERDPVLAARLRYVTRDVTSNDLTDGALNGRTYAIVIDDKNLPSDSIEIVMATRAAARYIVDGLGPTDVAAVIYARESGWSQDFTSDKTKLLAAVDKYNPAPMSCFNDPPPVRRIEGDMLRSSAAVSYTPCFRNEPVIPALDTVVSRLAMIPNRRKTLVLMTTGVPVSFGATTGCAGTLADTAKELMRRAQRANINVYPVDPSGYDGYDAFIREQTARGGPLLPNRSCVRAAPGRQRHDFSDILADNTGGRAVVRTDAIEPALDRVFAEDGSYYLVGYETSNGKPDGKFRKVEVKVRKSGTTVRARSGYYAPDENALGRRSDSPEPASADLNQLGLSDAIGLPIRATAAPVLRVTGSKNLAVAIALSVRLPAPVRPTPETLTIIRNVYDEQGNPGPPERELHELTLAPSTGDVYRYDVFSKLVLAPGRYQIRLNAASRAMARNSSIYADLEVPDVTVGAVSLSGLVLGTLPTGDRSDGLADLLPLVPTTSREFAPGDPLTAFIRVFQGGTGDLVPIVLDAEVEDGTAQPAVHLTTTLPAEAFATSRSAAWQFPLALERLPRGAHLLSITARTPTGRSQRREVVFGIK